MQSDQGCFSACFFNINSTTSELYSASNYRQERINDDLSAKINSNKIHSLSRKKDTKFTQKYIDSKKADALMMVIHNKIGKTHADKTPQKKVMKNDINYSSSRNVPNSKHFQSSVGSNFKSNPDQRSTNCKQYFSGNLSNQKIFKQSSLKISQGSQNQNLKADSNGSYARIKKCQILLIESRIKAKQRQSQQGRQKIRIQDDTLQENKKMSNHMLRNTKNLRYSMVESSSNSKQIIETPAIKRNDKFQPPKKPLSSTGITQQRRTYLQMVQITDLEKQSISQKRLFHNLSPSTGKKSYEKDKKQTYISLTKHSSQTSNYPLKLNKKTVDSYVSESKNTSKMSSIISKIVGQDGRKTAQLKHIHIIKLPSANNSYSNIPLEDNSFKDLNNCFLKKQPVSLNQKSSFSHIKKKDSPMEILMDESLGFFNDQSPMSIQLNFNSGLSSLSKQKKQKLQVEVIKNKFLGIGRYFNNYLSFIKQTGFVFNAKEVSAFTVKNQGIQHKIYQCLDISTRLFHPNILRVYYASNYKNKLTIYQELGQGNLDDELSNSFGRFSQEKTVKTLRSLLKGLAYIHSYAGNGFTHKSLKPKNIIFVNGTPKIQWLGYQDSMISGYISPQMRRGSPCGKKSDIWSIGIIAYVMIYGTMPVMEASFEPKKIQQVEQQKQGSIKESINKDSQVYQKVCLLEGDAFECKSFQYSLQSSKNQEKVEISQEFEDFLKNTLQEYERNRMSAIECLAHPLLRKYRSEEETPQISFNQRERF